MSSALTYNVTVKAKLINFEYSADSLDESELFDLIDSIYERGE